MILSNQEIREALRAGLIAVAPEPVADQYTTSAVDLYLGDQFRCWDDRLFKPKGARIDLNLAEQRFDRMQAESRAWTRRFLRDMRDLGLGHGELVQPMWDLRQGTDE